MDHSSAYNVMYHVAIVFQFSLECRTIIFNRNSFLSFLIFNFTKSYFGSILFWSINILMELRLEHIDAGRELSGRVLDFILA